MSIFKPGHFNYGGEDEDVFDETTNTDSAQPSQTIPSSQVEQPSQTVQPSQPSQSSELEQPDQTVQLSQPSQAIQSSQQLNERSSMESIPNQSNNRSHSTPGNSSSGSHSQDFIRNRNQFLFLGHNSISSPTSPPANTIPMTTTPLSRHASSNGLNNINRKRSSSSVLSPSGDASDVNKVQDDLPDILKKLEEAERISKSIIQYTLGN